ncbi:MAG TPA: YbhB/YbcL family Raf kinase inhibitor-like protein [Elusimicrobia bacterium]|nr:YbhB/YbcL family Raf kinase inhibitor-like protein [Elusimicrobiota bacterium]
MSFELKSTAFAANGFIPKKHSCEGADASPALSWSQPPKGAKSFALIMDDPDAPAGTWIHWVVYDLPAEKIALPEGMPKKETFPDGSKQGLAWGVDDFDRVGYGGPCTPPGPAHHYSLRLYALDKVLNLAPKATKAELIKAMEGHILGEAELVGLYKR